MDQDRFALTLAQQDIYFDQLRRPRSPLYNVGGYIRLGAIDVARLSEAHHRLVATHDIFGLRIVRSRADVLQTIVPERTCALPVIDFSTLDEPARDARAWADALFEKPLAIDGAELFRAHLLKLSQNEYWYIALAHHICMDGWGFANWAQTLSRLYNGPAAEETPAGSWKQVALEEAAYLSSERYSEDKCFWRAHLHPLPDRLLAPRHVRTASDSQGQRSSRTLLEVTGTDLRDLKTLARESNVSLAHVFQTMLVCYFALTCERDTLLLGLPFHNRRNHARKRMLGVFTGITPLRIQLHDPQCTVGQLLQQVAALQRKGLRHQRYPLGHMIRDLGVTRDESRPYDIGFNFLQLGGVLQFAGIDAQLVYLSHHHESTPLMVTAWESQDGGSIELQLDYSHGYFSPHDIALLKERFRRLVEIFPAARHSRVVDLDFLPDAEVRRLLSHGANVQSPKPRQRCIQHFFEEQVRRAPDAIAAVCGTTVLSYGELNARANRLAHALAARGVRAEVLVGVCMERSADMITAILGILKAGGAYVPLDPTYPAERISLLAGDSGARLILTERHLLAKLGGADVEPLFVQEWLDGGENDPGNIDAAQCGQTPDTLAYVIYTSGSTGTPKGVEICHGNTIGLIEWALATYSREELHKVLVSTSLNFDLSIFEIFVPLSCGERCVVVKDALALLTEPHDVTLINTVPSAIKVLIEGSAIPPQTRVVNLAGEPLPMQIVNDLLATAACRKVYNLYGPSEDTTYSTGALFTQPINEPPSIGRAIGDKKLYVLTSRGTLAPYGAVGELYIGGSGVARGYLHRPELTAERFVQSPFTPDTSERLYKTGDLVRWREDGSLDFIGRGDDQVKVRGYRVELGEIRWHVEQLSGVEAAAILAQPAQSGEARLIGFVVRERGNSSEGVDSERNWLQRLRSELQAKLPSYMIPAAFLIVDALPLTSNGKVDKRRLAGMIRWTADTVHMAPVTATERRLTQLWADLLGVPSPSISAEATLFGSGGHSLLAVRLARAIHDEWEVELPLDAFFDDPTLQTLASRIDAQKALCFVEERLSAERVVAEGYL
jgi:amino acid adenylation domain-containing protein